MKTRLTCGLLVAATALIATGLYAANAQQPKTMLVLDASGSMWGQIGGKPKIAIARQAVGAMLDGWNGGDLGLMVYGHRRDVQGYADALQAFDEKLGEAMKLARPDDLILIDADHGCDPTFTGTDHTREYIPVVAWTPQMTGFTDLGTRKTYADIAATIAEWFGLPDRFGAESFAAFLKR